VKTIRYEKRGHVAYVTLNRPERMNAVSRELARALLDTLDDFAADPDAWVVIISGSGEKAFSVGADLKDPAHFEASEKWEADYVRRLFSVKKPMIAAVGGHCLGAGLTIALACDLRIAADTARFGTPDQKLNTVDCAASLLLSHLMPSAVAMEILLTGDSVDAGTAFRTGLVSRVVPSEDLMATAGMLAEKVCGNGPLALSACKSLNRKARAMTIDEGTALFEPIAHGVLASDDTREGVLAFLEKRKPVWKGK
jgi:enoyl-CoA hydratase/carnithine racemase